MGRDQKITIERRGEGGRSVLNEPIENWQSLGQAYADRLDVSDGEKISAGHKGSALVARFRLHSATLSKHEITTADRLVSGGDIWNILGVKAANALGRGGFEITAVKNSREAF